MPSDPNLRFRAPGRVNIIGEHIDYLGGTVLPFACDLEVTVTAHPDREIEFTSPDADPRPYVRGVVEALREAGTEPLPRSGVLRSTIPIGAGLSSSAAIEVAIALAVTDGADIDPRVLQRAETIATGVRGGVMDQTAILRSRAGHALLLDCATGSYEHVAIPDDIAFVVIDTGTRRRVADGRYAERRKQVEGGDPKRLRHATSEQRRVYEAVDALRAADPASLGALLRESHASLRDDYEVSSAELDDAVERAMAHPACHGARLVGAGFAGCVLAVADPDGADALAHTFVRAWVVNAAAGAGPA